MSSEYMKEYRARNPTYAKENMLQAKCRQRALRKLGKLHKEEFDALFHEEIRKERNLRNQAQSDNSQEEESK